MMSEKGVRPHPILLIEDEAGIRELVEKILEDDGYECVCAGSCEEGRKKAETRDFGCALVDLGLPDGHGLSLLPYLKEKNPWIVPVILTGDARPATIMNTLREGVFDYLTKPVNIATLRNAVARALDHHEAIRERDRLFDLLTEEREQLKVRVEEATADIREYAAQLETGSARLGALVRLAQLSAELCTEDTLFTSTLEELGRCLPVRCVAVCTSSGQDLVAAVHSNGGDGAEGIRVVASESHTMSDSDGPVVENSENAVRTLVEHHIGDKTSSWTCRLYPQSFWGRPLCTVAFFLDADQELDAAAEEFLHMSAHLVASEWQEARLFLYTAKQASLGNIAMEITRGILQALTAIRTSADVVGELGVNEDAAQGLRIVCDNVETLQRQVQEFRQLAAPGKDTFETVALGDYVDQALEMLATSIQNRRITIVKEYGGAGRCVLLNTGALARTFLDLIAGALRRTEIGGQLVLRVADTEDENVVFETGFSDQAAVGDGTGSEAMDAVGLPSLKNHPKFVLAQRAIRSCGGRLYLGQGRDTRWVFRVTLPKDAMRSAAASETRAKA